MCEKCVKAVNAHFPGLSEKEMNVLLWEATPFPFGSDEDVERRLKDLATRSGGDVAKAVEISYREMDEAMATRDTEV